MRVALVGKPFAAAANLRVSKSLRTNPLIRRVTRMSADKSGVQLDKSTGEEVWKQVLTPDQYYVLRGKGTEPANTSQYNKFKENGVYNCAGCGTPLFTSDQKFDSGCGWPAFFDEIPGAVDRHEDISHGMKRVEITCAKCGGHLGHVFENEGFPNPTNIRHCVNGISVKFQPKAE